MKVCEIFTNIQGESTFAGVPCTFIRMTGCNLRCSYCDTAYAYEEGDEMSEKEIVERIQAIGLRTVELTGGEPLLQEEVLPLVKNLADLGYRVLIETNGSRDIQGLDKRAVIILDVKVPGSGMAGSLKTSNLRSLKPEDEVKFVIADRRDYEWSRDFVRQHALTTKCTVLFSPVFGTMDPQALSRWILHDRIEARLNLQLHKYIYGPEIRGV